MSCERDDTVLHAYFDNELDALSANEFERHLENCKECADALAALKSLRTSMSGAQIYERAPASLRKRILAEVSPAGTIAHTPSRAAWQWLAIAATVLLIVSIGWQVVSVNRSENKNAVLDAELVDAHLRSLQPGHLTDVISTDQHTVKPWFDGKLDFSPPVKDFAEQGFSLQGGRLDIIRGRAIAALVYGRRKHFVNVFIWPTVEHDTAPRTGSSQGYQWIDWRKGGMEFFAVADTTASDLEQLQRLIAE